SGLCSGLAGALSAGYLSSGVPTVGYGMELTIISAVVIGGTLLTGGKGTITGTVAGVLLLGVIQNLINQVGTLGSSVQSVVSGGFLAAVVSCRRCCPGPSGPEGRARCATGERGEVAPDGPVRAPGPAPVDQHGVRNPARAHPAPGTRSLRQTAPGVASRCLWSGFRRRPRPQCAVPGVDPWGECLLGGDPPEQLPKLGVFGGGQCRRQVALVLGGHRSDLLQQLLPIGGQMQGIQPPVRGVAATLDHAARLKAVDEGHQPGRGGAQLLGQRLLTAARLDGDRANQPRLRGSQVQVADTFGKPCRGVRAELSEQKGRTCLGNGPTFGAAVSAVIRLARVCAVPRLRCHGETITLDDHYSL